MGRVTVNAQGFNLQDELSSRNGSGGSTSVRSVTVSQALVDSGATLLSLPSTFIQQLGLRRVRTTRGRTANGVREFAIFEPVRLVVLGRECTVEVMELPDGTPALIGQIPLELLAFVIDMTGQRLIGDPFHGGEQLLDAF